MQARRRTSCSSFQQDGHGAPYTPQDRWENQSGYSPATIASEIAGLVCAADIARAQRRHRVGRPLPGDRRRVAAHAQGLDGDHERPVLRRSPYFLRLTKDGHPNAGTTYNIGDSGPSDVDQRTVVDPSFLELVRLGVLPANDPTVRNSIEVVDAQLGVPHRPRPVLASRVLRRLRRAERRRRRGCSAARRQRHHARPWLAAAQRRARRVRPRRRAAGAAPRPAGDDGERRPTPATCCPSRSGTTTRPAGSPGSRPGTPTFSATPLAWTHAQFIRLARDVAAGRVVEQPAVVAARYAGG